MAQTLVVWIIIGVSTAYLVRHFVGAWRSITQGKSNCESCGHCKKSPSEAQPIALVPRNQVVSMDSLLTATHPRRLSGDPSLQNKPPV